MSSVANINDLDAHGSTKLHHAALEGDLTEIKRLLAAGADISCRTTGRVAGQTALHIASLSGHIDVVRFLLNNGADIDDQTETGYVCCFTFLLAR